MKILAIIYLGFGLVGIISIIGLLIWTTISAKQTRNKYYNDFLKKNMNREEFLKKKEELKKNYFEK